MARLTDDHLLALGDVFSQIAASVEVLDISNNHLLTDASLCGTLERLARQASELRILRLGGAQLGVASIKQLAIAMASNPQLDELSLRSVPCQTALGPCFARPSFEQD
jgi:hypothetical protein